MGEKDEMIKVSIIVPVYNTEAYLKKCLNSLVNQTLKEIEIIVIDDGSTDHSKEIIQSFVEAYPDKVISVRKENGGQASARNLGIRICKGEYLGFIDSDDYAEQNMFEAMYKKAKKNHSDLIECDYHYIRPCKSGVKQVKKTGWVRKYKNQKDIFFDPYVAPWNSLYRTELVKRNEVYFPEGFIYEDTSFYIKMIPFVHQLDFVSKLFVYHIDRDGSTMNINKSKKVGDIFFVLEDIVTFYRNKGLYEQYKEELEYFCTKILFCSSLKRIAQVRDKTLRNQLLNQTLFMQRKYFEDYKKNKYLKHGMKSLYIKSMNPVTIKLYTYIFGMKYR